MDYNTQRKQLLLPEYGRNIQMMVDHLSTIENRDERNRAAHTVISVMGNLYPHLRDVSDFRHKLWDHLAIMSDFSLDIDAPYPLPEKSKLYEKPEKLSYGNHKIRFRHYGLMTEKLIHQINATEDPEQKRIMIVLTANHMKKSFLSWNKDSVEDEQIFDDIQTLYHLFFEEDLELPEGLTLSNPKEFFQKKTKPQQQNKGNNNKKYHHKKY